MLRMRESVRLAAFAYIFGCSAPIVGAQERASDETYSRAVEYLVGVHGGGVGVSAVIGTPQPWVMLTVLSARSDSTAKDVFLLPPTSASLVGDLRRLSRSAPAVPRDSIVTYFRDELGAGEPLTIYAIREDVDGAPHVRIRVFSGAQAERSEAATLLSVGGANNLANAVERAAQRPVGPPRLPARWRLLRNTESQTVFVDTVSIRRALPATAELWIRLDSYSESGEEEMSAFMEFRCAERRYSMTQISVRERRTGRSRTTPGASNPDERWRSMAPESVAELAFDFACSPSGTGRRPTS